MVPQGLGRKRQVRSLICDGATLLGWVGGFRDRPFGHAALEVLRQLTPPLRARLKLEKQLALARAYRETLFHAIDALETPAFVLLGERIEHANPAGRSRLDSARETTCRELEARMQEGNPSCFTIARSGLPVLKLITLRPAEREVAALLHVSKTRWRLSPRQIEVLAHLAEGDTNKEIAAKLGCAEVTVEFHLRGLFNKTASENRSELVALFWKQA
jgi:DNA-binding CsgD family transcriptional regulator